MVTGAKQVLLGSIKGKTAGPEFFSAFINMYKLDIYSYIFKGIF